MLIFLPMVHQALLQQNTLFGIRDHTSHINRLTRIIDLLGLELCEESINSLRLLSICPRTPGHVDPRWKRGRPLTTLLSSNRPIARRCVASDECLFQKNHAPGAKESSRMFARKIGRGREGAL